MLAFFLSFVQTAHAASLPGIKPVGNPGSGPSTPSTVISNLYTDVFNIITLLAGALAVIYVIWAGVQYISSNGSPDKIKTARASLINAVIGVIIVIAAYGIVRIGIIVGNEVAGSTEGISGASSETPSTDTETTEASQSVTLAKGQTYTAKDNQTVEAPTDGTVTRSNGDTDEVVAGQTVSLESGDSLVLKDSDVIIPSGIGAITGAGATAGAGATLPTPSSTVSSRVGVAAIDSITQKTIPGVAISVSNASGTYFSKGQTSATSALNFPLYESGVRTIKASRSGYKTCTGTVTFNTDQALGVVITLVPGTSSQVVTCGLETGPLDTRSLPVSLD